MMLGDGTIQCAERLDTRFLKPGLWLLGASIFAYGTRDRNRSAVEYIRSCGVGGLVAVSTYLTAQGIFERNLRLILGGSILCAFGFLCTSQKDLKRFFGLLKGISFNPPSDLTDYLKKNDHGDTCKISDKLRSYIERKKFEQQPYIQRIFLALVHSKSNDDVKASVEYTTYGLYTQILPYLRVTLVEDGDNEPQWKVVYDDDTLDDSADFMDDGFIRKFMSLDEYTTVEKT